MNINNQRYYQTFFLSNGKQLGYAEYGNLEGIPLFHFHGTPSYGRLEGIKYEGKAVEHNIHLIMIDRPGYGLSQYHADFTLLDWPDYVNELANKLGIKKYHISGWSGGGPFALACGYKYPEKFHSINIVAGSYKMNSEINDLPGYKQYVTDIKTGQYPQMWVDWMESFHKASKTEKTTMSLQTLENDAKSAPTSDQQYFNNPDYQQLCCQLDLICFSTLDIMEGWLHDQQILHEFRPWNFRVQDILDSVKITLHYGEQDLVMISQGQQLSVAIPFATFKTYPEKGHLSTMLDNLDTIFSSLR